MNQTDRELAATAGDEDGTRILVLLRHAKAEPENGLGDHARPLAGRGRLQAKALGSDLRAAVGRLDVALVSGASRTRETYKLLAGELLGAPEATVTDELYDAGPRDVLRLLRGVAPGVRSVLVVGHEPTISTLGHLLDGEGGEHAAAVRFGVPTATAVLVEVPVAWAELDRGTARIAGILRPQE